MIDAIFPTFLLFLFSFDVQCHAVLSIYTTVFQEKVGRVGSVGLRGKKVGG